MSQLTTNALRAIWRGKDRWLSDGGARGGGRLVARVTRDGVALLFQHFASDGKKRYLPLGPYDASGARGLSLPRARDRAAELSSLYRGGVTNLHDHFKRKKEEDDRARKAADNDARRAQEEALRGTLRQLLDAYVGHLKQQGKQSAKDVRSIFDAHVFEAAPELAPRKASELSVDDFVGLIGKLTEANKGRTAAKLRSYLSAAYSLAIRSKTDPSAPLSLRTFGIATNPISGIGALSKFSRARDRALSGPELAAFIKKLEELPDGPQKDALRLCILLGGQRPVQLLRVRPADVDISAATITLMDGKGARQQPRRHVLPLTRDASAILKRRLDGLGDGEPLFSTDEHTQMRIETISVLVADMSHALVTTKEAREPFQLRDIRRTIETQLAGLQVSSDVRAQLQSHGLGGVQQRHYDRHEYALEKRAALEKWGRHLAFLKAGNTATVVPLSRARKRSNGKPVKA